MSKRRVLLTGASGYIASQMLPTFRERFDCTLVDVRDTDRNGAVVPGVRIADLARGALEENRALFSGVDAVVHLGYIHPPSGQGSRSVDSFYTERLNVDMAFNVYQLAFEEGVRRVVVASSNHAADWYEGLIHAKKKDMVDPWERAVSDNFYGWAKEAYEHLGFVYASGRLGRKLEMVQIRIGAPRDLPVERYRGNPVGFNRDLGAYISPRDLTQLFVKSVETPEIGDGYDIPFQIFYGISDNTRKFWSIQNARAVIGYAPEDDSEVKYWEAVQDHLISLGTPVPARDFNPGPGTA
jgi:nucleoside-diphosphate-sugar epimerase